MEEIKGNVLLWENLEDLRKHVTHEYDEYMERTPPSFLFRDNIEKNRIYVNYIRDIIM